MAILNNSNAISSGGYDINNSLRFRASASAQLTRTPAGAGNNTKMTFSLWTKRGELSKAFQNLITSGASAGNGDAIIFTSGDAFRLWFNGGSSGDITTSQVFRDPSAWYHIVVAIDTTQATAANRIKIYVNGSQVTAFASATYPNQNYAIASFNTTTQQQIGYGVTTGNGGNYFDGYMAEVNFVDGSQLTPSSFGETDTTTGSWKPKAYTGTYGTNGFYLKFSDIATTSGSNAGLGKDFSGNANYWTTNNISVTAGTTYDAMIDSPTLTSATVANYPTLNPLKPSDSGWTKTISGGNLNISIVYSSGANMVTIPATMETPSSGKWYWEVTPTSASTTGVTTGIGITTTTTFIDSASPPVSSYGYSGGGTKFTDAANNVAYGASYATNDVIGVALDIDSGTITFYKNNTSQGTAYTGLSAIPYYPCVFDNASGTRAFSINFGQRPFSYTPPTGFVRLNTYNLPDSTIKKGNTVMDATLYTGNGTGQSVVNAGTFKPDLVWVKSRSTADWHQLVDSRRGVGTVLFTNSTAGDQSYPTSITAFNSNGFTVGADSAGGWNLNGTTIVGWQWQAGQGSTSNIAINQYGSTPSIASTVSVNATAGFSVVTYTGTGANATVGHGLGVAPKFIVIKRRNGVSDWICWHTSISQSSNYAIDLDRTAAAYNTYPMWNTTSPTSSVFNLGTDPGVNGSTNTYVAYCWAAIAGYSAFGNYTGNGSTDGSFVYTGFLPRFVMIKRTDTTGDWYMWDTARNTYDVITNTLLSNSSAAETSATSIDALSNGFKLRNTTAGFNASGGTYIYAAFASNPFRNSNAF